MPIAPAPDARGSAAPPRLGWRAVSLATIGYIAAVCVATYPFALSFTKGVAGSLFDPLHHLWIMRWYKSCLLEWRSPVMCPELQYPVGAPLGNFATMHMQAILYFPLSFIFNDVICFNLIWMTGIVTTGLGTMLLIWHVLRDRRVAAIGGFLAMISGPMMIHSRSHLEILYVGCFPAFLVVWMRFVASPTWRRLAGTVAMYVVVALCSPYYAVFVIVPAALDLSWRAFAAFRTRDRAWFAERARWLTAFGLLAVPAMILIFGNQLWAMAKGYSVARTVKEFAGFGCPPWTYLAPTILHRFSALMPVNPYDSMGPFPVIGERTGYLGVVTLFLVVYAMMTKAPLPRRAFWWTALAVFIILASGAYWNIGDSQIKLPGYYLKKYVFLFKLIRVPGRFSLYTVVMAALIAAAGLKQILANTRSRWRQRAILAGLVALALLDLQTRPFPAVPVPSLPAAYEFIKRTDPGAGIVEIPQGSSGGSTLSAICGYWQSFHGLRTSSGYSGHANVKFDNRLTFNSPFQQTLLGRDGYLRHPDDETIDIVHKVDALEYTWLYLHANRFRFVLLHEWPGADDAVADPMKLDRLKALLEPARVFSGEGVTVYDREKLRPPHHAVPLTTDGWRIAWHGKLLRVAEQEAKLLAYNPDASRPVKLVLEAAAFPHPRTVRLLADGEERARWTLASGPLQLYISPAIKLPEGTSELVLECDGETRPRREEQRAAEWDDKPYSLYVGGLALIDAEEHDRASQPTPPQVAAESQVADEPGPVRR